MQLLLMEKDCYHMHKIEETENVLAYRSVQPNRLHAQCNSVSGSLLLPKVSIVGEPIQLRKKNFETEIRRK